MVLDDITKDNFNNINVSPLKKKASVGSQISKHLSKNA